MGEDSLIISVLAPGTYEIGEEKLTFSEKGLYVLNYAILDETYNFNITLEEFYQLWPLTINMSNNQDAIKTSTLNNDIKYIKIVDKAYSKKLLGATYIVVRGDNTYDCVYHFEPDIDFEYGYVGQYDHTSEVDGSAVALYIFNKAAEYDGIVADGPGVYLVWDNTTYDIDDNLKITITY